jgi:hypothetical protein
MLKNTGARRIVYIRHYPGHEEIAAYWVRENLVRERQGLPPRVIEQYEKSFAWLKEVL